MADMKLLRSGITDDSRYFMLEAGTLSPGQWEAWFACFRVTNRVGVGSTSPTLRVAKSVADLEQWAAGLTDAQLRELAAKYCP